MAYIGKAPVNGFHSKQTLSTDGSTTTFTLDFTVADETALIVSVGGVLQEPKVAYNLSGGGTSIVFTAAPAATDTAYIQFLGQAIVQNLNSAGGAELILDADNDTSLTADTDDQIDIKIAGADDFQFTANKFSILTGSNQSFADNTKGLFGTGDDLEVYHDGTNSYIANKTGALKIATETSGIALTIGHTTSETTVADNLTVTGNLTVGGTTSFGDFDITNVGSIALDTITNDGTDITLDSSADIVIDAAGGNVEFKDAGTLQLTLDMDGTAGAQVIQLGVDSDDLIFKQYDGTTVLTLDDDTTVKVATDLTIGDDASLISDAAVLNFGADSEIKLTHVADTGLLLTDSGGSPTLQLHDANEAVSSDGSKLILTSNGVAFSLPTADGSANQVLATNGSAVLSFADNSGGQLIQTVNTTRVDVVSGTTVMPFDDSIPQKTEGVEFLTVAITPTKNDNKLLISVHLQCQMTNNGQWSMALFQDDTANALAASSERDGASDLEIHSLKHFMTTGTTSETTFKIRSASSGSGTITMNSVAGSRKYGGVLSSSITVQEIEV